MKKFLFCLFAIMLVMCCIGCGNSDDEIICSACGEAFENTAKFCPNCGEAVDNPQINGGDNNESGDNNSDGNNNPSEAGLTVNSSKEFLNTIDDNKKIILNGGTYNLYGLTGINNSKVEKDPAEFATDGYIISNVSNLEIIGKGTFVALGGNDVWATGLTFTNCKNITISNVDFKASNNSELDWTQLLVFSLFDIFFRVL